LGVFGNYARYYDLLYSDKNYLGEVDFVSALLKRHVPDCRTICELGCGTGMHAMLLAQRGYAVHGIDLSEQMLEAARTRLAAAPAEVAKRLRFSVGDARNFHEDAVFDAVLALFHVVSYQVTNDDLIGMFKNAAGHLRPGGVFVFDYWFGPAVLTDRPSVRIKRMETDETTVTRLAEPVLRLDESQVDVNYHVFIRDKASGAMEELRETHRMRYLFLTEIDLIARISGLRVLDSCEWLTGSRPGPGTWGVCSVLSR
jgi:SAM-dependent methyltransferase